jgi:hypothetical protein
MTRTRSETKTRARQSPLPVIGAVVAIILVVFYGWSQRGWLANVTDIESRDVDMQSQQLQRGFATELDDLYSAMGDYAIWNETAEFVRGNRPGYVAQSLNAGALVRLNVDTFLVLDRNLETRASLALDANAVQQYEIPPDTELLAVIKQSVTSGQLNNSADKVHGIVQRARGPALFAVRPVFDSTGASGSPVIAVRGPKSSASWIRRLASVREIRNNVDSADASDGSPNSSAGTRESAVTSRCLIAGNRRSRHSHACAAAVSSPVDPSSGSDNRSSNASPTAAMRLTTCSELMLRTLVRVTDKNAPRL